MPGLIAMPWLIAAASGLPSAAEVALGLGFGGIVGFSLGLTGGGGSIFAVPLLVYGLAVRPRGAVGVSLAAVGATALVGGLRHLGRGEVEMGTGLMFAAAGILGALVGAWLGRRVPEGVLLVLFAALMLGCGCQRRESPRRPWANRPAGPGDPQQHCQVCA